MKTDLILVLFGFPTIALAYAWFVYWMQKEPGEAPSGSAPIRAPRRRR